jgi:hypothetical protein
MGDAAKLAAFGLFVSAVADKPVSRFGAPGVFIGAERDPDNPRKLRYHIDRVVAIPLDEAQRYSREYARLIADGELVARDEKAWKAQQAADQRTAETKAKAKEQAKAKAAAEAQRVTEAKDDHGAQSGS